MSADHSGPNASGSNAPTPNSLEPTKDPQPNALLPQRALAAPSPAAHATSRSALERLYGAGPLHLVAVLSGFILAGYSISRIIEHPSLLRISVWFVGVALFWDLLAGPLLAGLDSLLMRLTRSRAVSRPRRGVAAINFVRAPLLFSLLLLAVYSPVILERSEPVVADKAGLDTDPFLMRWVLITLVLSALSAAGFTISRLRARRALPAAPRHPEAL